jgi:hypothetical protein
MTTQVSIVAPYRLELHDAGNIQVTNNGVASNLVEAATYLSQPGMFQQSQNGIGIAAAVHAATGELVDAENPAQPGEYISIYMTGLGLVTPAIDDGAVGPSNALSTVDLWTNGSMSMLFKRLWSGRTFGIRRLGHNSVCGARTRAGGIISGQCSGAGERIDARRCCGDRNSDRRRADAAYGCQAGVHSVWNCALKLDLGGDPNWRLPRAGPQRCSRVWGKYCCGDTTYRFPLSRCKLVRGRRRRTFPRGGRPVKRHSLPSSPEKIT